MSFSSLEYKCSHCGKHIASDKGFYSTLMQGRREFICICHFCQKPTYIDFQKNQFPGVAFGDAVDGIDDESVKDLYEEARNCASVNAYTATAMACRKVLMNIAVAKGAEENQRFVQYVQYLASNHYIPPDGEKWVEHIKDKGNEANHEIQIVAKKDAEELIYFTEMLLSFIYAVPARFRKTEKGD